MAKHINNIFKNLQIDEDDEYNDINMARKATKKIREIESLKKKDNIILTESEKDKILKESFWKDILNPVKNEPQKESMNDIKKRLKRERERQKKQDEIERRRIIKEEYERVKLEKEENKLKEERNRQEEERNKQEEERNRQEEERNREKEERKRQKERNRQINKQFISIENEYKKQLIENNGNTKKAFHKCSLKFHPDKNIGNQIIANENQKILSQIHEKYSR